MHDDQGPGAVTATAMELSEPGALDLNFLPNCVRTKRPSLIAEITPTLADARRRRYVAWESHPISLASSSCRRAPFARRSGILSSASAPTIWLTQQPLIIANICSVIGSNMLSPLPPLYVHGLIYSSSEPRQ